LSGGRALLVLALALAIGAAAVILLVWWGHERVVWQPPRGPHAGPGNFAGARRVDYRAADGQPLFGYLITPTTRPAPDEPPDDVPTDVPNAVLLAFHGNAEVAADEVPSARELARRTGWAVLLAKYRGYAGLPGRSRHEGSRGDAAAAYRWLRETLGVPPRRIGLFGFSLGSAVAAELAAALGDAERPALLVLQSPLSSTHEMARAMAPGLVGAVWPWIERVPFDTRRRVAETDVPVWVVHGDADRVIPRRMGERVHAAARRAGGLLLVRGAGHNDVPLVGGARYWSFLADALAQAAGPRRASP
jgi:pimeloyl-ACP methyl ester carboxylesterase